MLCGYCYHANKIDKIIQSNFEDWKELGIQVDYCVPIDMDEGSEARMAYILFTLPLSGPKVSSFV